jgi:serine/threonine-protein kinase HipA
MTGIRSLRIKLGNTDVGSLIAFDDGRVHFRFDEAYAFNEQRPVLSVSFIGKIEPETVAQLLDTELDSTTGAGSGRLPAFFRNLLPEGILRKYLVTQGGLLEGDELALLAYCGEGLPGDVRALAEPFDAKALGRLLPFSGDSIEASLHPLPSPVAIAISGFQPKVALANTPDGRYVLHSLESTGRHFIGKLPASDFAGLPEVEYTSLLLAKAAGVNVCTAELQPLSAIASTLPFSVRDDARNFLLVHRFDRDASTDTGRLQMEDFAQALELAPDEKYEGSYAAIGLVLQMASSASEEDVFEILRRIKVNELLGNYDAHVKNFSLLHYPSGLTRLSPAYDLVAYAAYIEGKGHALKFHPAQKAKSLLTPVVLRELSNIWAIPETRMKDVVATAVDAAMRAWPAIIEGSVMAPTQKAKLLAHMEKNPSVQAWRRRHGKSKGAERKTA